MDDENVHYLPVNPSPERFVDKHAVAAYLGVSVKWVEMRGTDRSFPSHKIGAFRKYRLSEVAAWVDERKAG